MRNERTGAVLAALAAFVALLLIEMWSQIDGVLTWPGAVYSDLVTAHLPLSVYLKRAISHYGALPLWNPLILGGQPLVGDPLAGLTYPPYWLTYLLPTPGTFNLLLALHLVFGGWGLYRLARAHEQPPAAALLAGIAFAGSPRWLGQWGLGHVTLTYALAWTPWLLLAARRAVRSRPVAHRVAAAALAGGMLGLVASLDPRWAPPAALLAVAYSLFLLAHSHSGEGALRSVARAGLVAGVAALGAGMALLAPLWQFVRLSTRWAMTAGESQTLSLPPAAMLQILMPDPGVWPEWSVGVGASVLLLAVVGTARGRAIDLFWAGTALVGWILSLGESTPLFRLARLLVPGLSLTRVPARLSFLSVLAVAMLAAGGLAGLLEESRRQAFERRARLAIAAGLALICFLMVGLALVLGPAAIIADARFGWTALVASALGVLLFLCLQRSIVDRRLLVGILALTVADLVYLGSAVVEARPVIEAPVPAVLLRGSGGFGGSRFFSPSYSLSQLTGAQSELELADGVNPLQLQSYWDFMSSATGFESTGYSVTLPPYPGGDPAVPWSPDLRAARLGLLSVSHVVSAYELPQTELPLVAIHRGRWVYRNPYQRPRAWVQQGDGLSPEDTWRPVREFVWEPNAVQVLAEGPGVLVVAENDYPGWHARVDGEPASLLQVGGLLRGVQIGQGEHQVEFVFRPLAALLGALVSFFSWLLIFGLWWRTR